MRIFYSPNYTVAAHSFETTRKSRWIAESLACEPIATVALVAPEPISATALSRVHDPEYVRAVRNGSPRELAESQGFPWDPTLWDMVCASNGGAMAAAIEALRTRQVSGSLSSGLHHARRTRGAGFCTFNGLVLARRCKGRSPSRIRQMGERSPERRQEDGRVRVLRILRERKARPSQFPCRRQQMANRSPLASSWRSIERLTSPPVQRIAPPPSR